MYGRGNYAPQFGQGLQRPMPPFQQPPAGHPAPLQFQPGQPFPMQQGGMPHAGPPRGPGYPHILPAPLNAGQSFGQRPLVQGGPPARYPFPGSQQNFPSGAPNPPPSVGPSGSLPPPPLQRPAAYSLLGPHSNPGMQQGVRHMSLLPPPPPPHAPTGFFPLPRQPPGLPPPQPPSSMPMVPNMPSSSIAGGSPMTHGDIPQKQILESASVEVKTNGGREGSLMSHTDMSMRESALLEHSSPPKPADETVRNIEVLCQFIAKNGSQFEEMVRKNESGNPKFSFLVGGEPGSEASSAREYYLWMKKKYGLLNDSGNGQEEKNLSQSHPDVNVATVHSPADSDVDMEDDITQTDKESEVYNSFEDLNSGSVSTGVMLEMQKQETTLLYANDGSSALNSPPVKSEEQKEIKPEDSSGQLGKTDNSFGLVQNYASDDNSDDELPDELGGAQAVTPPPKSAVPTLCDDSKSVDKVSTEREALAVQTLTTCGSSDNHEIDGRYDGDEPLNLNPTFHGSSGIDSTSSKGIEALAVQTESQGTSIDVGLMGKHAIDDKFDGDNERKDKTRTLSAVKVDEFGRLVKEGASDSDSDDTQYVRHRGRKNRSRSRSRSPPDRKRRSSPLRSPRRRKGRRSRSRSRSPKRRRSRSRSPYHSVGDFSGEKLRQGKVQTQECFDFSKGRCYRGASCQYLHHDMGKNESSRRYKSKEYHEIVPSAKKSEFSSSITSTPPIEREYMKGEKIPYHQNTHDDNGLTSNTNDGIYKAESRIDGVSYVFPEDVENLPADFKGSEGHREDASHVREASEVHLPQHPIAWENPTFEMPSMSQSVHSLAETHKKCDDNSTIVGSGKIDSSADVTSVISPSGISTDSYHVLAANKPTSPRASISTFPNQASHSPQQLLTSQSINSSSFPLQTVSFNAVPPYHAPLPGQKSPHPDPANLRWGVLPTSQPRPAHVIDSSISGAPFQQGDIHMRNELPNYMSLRVQPGELTGHPQAGRFQYQTYHLPSSNVSGTQFAGPSVVRDGGSQSVSSYASEPLVREQPSHVASVGASGIAAHYNPYASTFDQPLSSRFSSAFAQERVSSSGIKYDHSFSLSHGPGEGQAASGYGSRQILSSPNSLRAGDRMPRLGGVQYDPLFDSIEPSSKRAVKDQAADNSDMLKVGSHKTLDVAENKQKEVVATTSLDNDEYGETADAEVGVVENASLSDTDDDAIIAEGEIEIDQIKGGNDTTTKDSRSMKLFKVAVANFVKEVLKPQWRQGNMSKEVFKTIVKKTVDKVSGAMKNHRVPKSQAKIDQYINSSRRKLIQLVEGYVSKYKS